MDGLTIEKDGGKLIQVTALKKDHLEEAAGLVCGQAQPRQRGAQDPRRVVRRSQSGGPRDGGGLV